MNDPGGSERSDQGKGSLVTRNRRGRTTETPNEIAQEFIDFAVATRRPVLDIGAAFGVATIPALTGGATVIANDVDRSHLEALRRRTPQADRARLTLEPATFPYLNVNAGSLAAVLASNVLNFLRGEVIEVAARRIAEWLQPGGRVFAISGTPYAANIQNYIPHYEARRRRGDRWPGEVYSLHDWSSDPTIAELPSFLHLLDDAVLRRTFEDAGFHIERLELFRRANLPAYLRWDGRENVAMVATIHGN